MTEMVNRRARSGRALDRGCRAGHPRSAPSHRLDANQRGADVASRRTIRELRTSRTRGRSESLRNELLLPGRRSGRVALERAR